jgi:hypothetical protein
MKFNIYCDESCHLEHDNQKYMVLGGMICGKSDRNRVKREILEIKKRHGIKSTAEIKWNKVSQSKISYYKELVDYFFDNESLRFRALVIDKTQLRHNEFKQTHDDWYYKMYYQLLLNLVEPKQENYIYLDIKDTKSSKKVEGLKKYLRFKLMDYDFEVIKNIQSINSQESIIMQLSDLIIGSIGYRNRKIYDEKNSSVSKRELMMHVIEKSGYSLNKSTFLSEKKFNLFFIELKAGDTIG